MWYEDVREHKKFRSSRGDYVTLGGLIEIGDYRQVDHITWHIQTLFQYYEDNHIKHGTIYGYDKTVISIFSNIARTAPASDDALIQIVNQQVSLHKMHNDAVRLDTRWG